VVQTSRITQLEYNGEILDFFTIQTPTENLDRIELSYRNNTSEGFVMTVNATVWKSVILQPGQIANILVRDGEAVDVIANMVYSNGEQVRESFQIAQDGEMLNIVLYDDPNLFLTVTLYIMVIGYVGYVMYPYAKKYINQKENPLVS
jgi:hypothetical protein